MEEEKKAWEPRYFDHKNVPVEVIGLSPRTQRKKEKSKPETKQLWVYKGGYWAEKEANAFQPCPPLW